MSEMFCFQCQQTAGGSGCVRTGVCGKQPATAAWQDRLVCRLIRLAQACEKREEFPKPVTCLLADGLFTTLTNVNFDDEAICWVMRIRRSAVGFTGDWRRWRSSTAWKNGWR